MGPVVVRRHCLAEGIMLSWEMHQLLFSVSLYRSSINFFLIMSHFVHRLFIVWTTGFSSAVTNTMLLLASLLISTEISHISQAGKLSAKGSFCKIFCDVLLYEYYSPTVAMQAQVVLLPRLITNGLFHLQDHTYRWISRRWTNLKYITSGIFKLWGLPSARRWHQYIVFNTPWGEVVTVDLHGLGGGDQTSQGNKHSMTNTHNQKWYSLCITHCVVVLHFFNW